MRLVVIGAGGHAAVVVDAARECGHDVVAAVDATRAGAEVLGVPVLDAPPDADGCIVAVGDNAARAAESDRYAARDLAPVSVVHPTACVSSHAEIGPGCFVGPGAVVAARARIGAGAILNTSCSVDHDCVIGDHAHVGPGAHLCGGVRVGARTTIGVGASLIPGVSVGDDCMVGAGAAVTEDVPSNTTVVGVPARITGAAR